MSQHRPDDEGTGSQTLARAASRIIVGIGASAGALDALKDFLALVPADSGLAFVVVQHLDRQHKSLLSEILARHTSMPVREAAGGPVEPNHVYVIPPNTSLTLEQGVLHLAPAAASGLRLPVDIFLRSLADDRGEDAVGIVLSGTGADGTIGLRAIKERGGLTIAQSPETAKYEGMPESAIATGLVDFVLPVEEIPARLLEYRMLRDDAHRESAQSLDAEIAENIGPICAVLQRRTGHDFARYKESTLVRRIRRRVLVRHSASAVEYLRCLEEDPGEPELLLRNLLISVTQFFRDPAAFQILAKQVVPGLFEGRPANEPVRIWVPGCASGEEAYSIAMVVREHLSGVSDARTVQIFATDIDTDQLAKARQGLYPEEIREQVSPERLARFFAPQPDGSFHIAKEVRETCVFSPHNLIRDPPFSSIDLISCRNVLIYLEADQQKALFPLFHYALRPSGFLFLGPSEGLAAYPELFSTVDRTHRIFRRNDGVSRPRIDFPLSARSAAAIAQPRAMRGPPIPRAEPMLTEAFERVILAEYAPACAVIDERGEIFYAAGRTGLYLQSPPGGPSHDIFEMAHGLLGAELRSALIKAAKTGRKVVRKDVPMDVDGRQCRLRLTVRPMPGAAPETRLFMVILQEAAPPEELEAEEDVPAAADAPVIEQLNTELRTTRADLQSAMEELASANEDLRSSNEELVSTNEELQSANEELQTSKEEMQSTNEELESVNSELHEKVEEVTRVSTELQNLYASSQIATVFLDPQLRIARFTPAAKALLHLIDADIGRPLADLAARFAGEHLLADADHALRTGTAVERQVHTAEGVWLIKRVLPYRTLQNAITAVSITFVDITSLKKTEETLRKADEFNRRIIDNSHDSIAVLDLDGNLLSMSPGGQRLLGIRYLAPLLHTSWMDLWKGGDHDVAAREVAKARAGEAGQFQGYCPTASGTPMWWDVIVSAMVGADGKPELLLAVSRDVTERKKAEEALRDSEKRFRTMADSIPQLAWSAHADGFIYWYNERWYRYTGTTPEQMEGWGWQSVHDPTALPSVLDRWKASIATGEPFDMVFPLRGADGRFRPFLTRVQPFKDSQGNVVQWFGTNTEVSDIQEARDAARRSEEKYRQLFQRMLDGFQLCRIIRDDAGRPVDFLYLDVNGMFPVLTGLEDVVGKRVSEVIPGIQKSNPELFETYGRVASTGQPERFDIYVPQLDRHFMVSVYSPGGEDRFVAVFDNITERKRAEEALRQSEERFRLAQELSPDGFLIYRPLRDGTGAVTDFLWMYENDAAARMNDTNPDEVRGKRVSEVLPHHDQSPFHKAYKEVAETGEVRVIEEAFYDQDTFQQRRWFRVAAVPTTGRDVAVLVQDVTARKSAEEALLHSREGLRGLAEASLSVMAATDVGGMLQAISEAALALTDAHNATCGHGDVAGRAIVGGSARAPDAPGCPPGEMFVLDRGGVHMDLIESTEAIRLTDAQLRAHPRWWGGPAGHIPLRGLLGVRMVGRNGKTNGMILVTDKAQGDFTDEDESLLCQLATIASLALQHVEARISLEESDRSKSHFLAMLSHELRNPLAPIRNSLYILDRAAPGGDQARRAHSVIDRQVGHLTRLVDDLLDMTRISRGKIQLQREPVDLNELIRRAVDDHRSLFDQNGLQLYVELAQRPLWINADRTRLIQVVGNLLQNSAKFTELGGRISVSLTPNDDLRQAVVRVRDTGVGIGADMIPRVFEPFAQADTTLSRSKGGLGLGLALVKALVDMHDGSVTVESEGLGKGTEFVMRLPLDGVAPQPLGTVAPAGIRPQRIVVIEDNIDAATSLSEVLELDGHSVAVAYSAREGIEKTRAQRPDVVFCDIGLPDIDGYQVAQAIKGDPALRNTRLVALTGYAAPEDVAKTRVAGFDAHVAKPPSIEALKNALTESKS